MDSTFHFFIESACFAWSDFCGFKSLSISQLQLISMGALSGRFLIMVRSAHIVITISFSWINSTKGMHSCIAYMAMIITRSHLSVACWTHYYSNQQCCIPGGSGFVIGGSCTWGCDGRQCQSELSLSLTGLY
jgi:hypothetical protein